MRLWTINPRYLDRQGLLAVWREALLAQAVLLGKTRGYVHHPQLFRFREQRCPVASVASYLEGVLRESECRGYHFDNTVIQRQRSIERIRETCGQMMYEWRHLLSKVQKRSPEHFMRIRDIAAPEPHPIFEIVPGEIRGWEKQNSAVQTL